MKLAPLVAGVSLCLASAAAAAPFAYIPNSGDNNLSVIDTATDTVVATVALSANLPQTAAVSADGMRVYASGLGGAGGRVDVINAVTNSIAASIPTFGGISALAISPDGTRLYGPGGSTVKIVNTTTNALMTLLSHPSTPNPQGVAFHPSLPLAYIVGVTFQNAFAIDTTTQTVSVPSIPTGSSSVVISPDGTTGYTLLTCTSCFPPAGVARFDTATNLDIPGWVATAGTPQMLAMEPDGATLYVTVRDHGAGTGSLSVIDTATFTETTAVPMGGDPWGVALHPDGVRMYVVDRLANSVYVVDRSTYATSATIPVGNLPFARGAFIGPIATCGDGDVTFPEQCDDGNTTAGDCCSATCTLETGLPCEDGEVCTDGDTCDANAACVPGPPLDCDDSNLCTEDSCDLGVGCVNDDTPRSCLASGKSVLIVKQNTDPSKNQMLWKWLKGAATEASEFGEPIVDTDYAVCLYGGATSTLVTSVDVPSGGSWSEAGAGYKYKDLLLSSDGVQKVILKPGDAGKTKIIVKAKGSGLPSIDLNALTDPVRVQMVNSLTSSSGDCWESSYTGAEIDADEGKLKAKD